MTYERFKKQNNLKLEGFGIKITKEVYFYIFYLVCVFLILINTAISFNKYDYVKIGDYLYNFEDMLMILFLGFLFLFLVSFFSKYIIIRFGLNPDIRYGDLSSTSPVNFMNGEYVYVKCQVYNGRTSSFSENDGIEEIAETELYSDNIYFNTKNENIEFTEEFKNIGSYICQDKTVVYSYDYLMKNYDELNLKDVITKDELTYESTIMGTLFENKEFSIVLNYIENNNNIKKDVVVKKQKVLSDYTFSFKQLGYLVFMIVFYLFAFHSELFIDTEQDLITLIIKTLEYNAFIYCLLFFLLKKYLYR